MRVNLSKKKKKTPRREGGSNQRGTCARTAGNDQTPEGKLCGEKKKDLTYQVRELRSSPL